MLSLLLMMLLIVQKKYKPLKQKIMSNETIKTTKPADTKTSTVKEENTTVQSPSGSTTKTEIKTTVTVAPKDATKFDKNIMDKRTKKIVNIASFGSSVGLIAGLGYAFSKKKGFWSYVGYGILGSVVFGTVAGLGAKVILKGEKDEKKA